MRKTTSSLASSITVNWCTYRGNKARGYEIFVMLNSAEHENLNAYKHKNIKKLSFVHAQKA